ncbi:MAG: 50S ribosomal protein L4 [Synergistaceae bacterium]|nr:50S ribosomal protein L4 [Synergistaceae bacterium]MCL2163993.1 50S ribosomal protein L4 [Oscillospiraceae bacterium]
MPKLDLYDMEGTVVGEIELDDSIFGVEINESVLHIVVHNQLANKRQGTQSTKTKSEVSGGGKKPYRQKGTGRARHGSKRSAQWIKGGIVLGPKPRSYRYTVPKKVRRLAMKSALSTKAADNNIMVLDKLALDEIKTKKMIGILKNLNVSEDSVLVVLSGRDENIQKSARNIPGVKTTLVNTLNVYDILRHDKFIVTKEAVDSIEEVYV